ncbi:hypothetical protein, partial [Salmonella enterica]|uniref:hypothetical protein n=1 Tax=Salmonella enterica TaxID=28901 RepID=UPI00352681CF
HKRLRQAALSRVRPDQHLGSGREERKNPKGPESLYLARCAAGSEPIHQGQAQSNQRERSRQEESKERMTFHEQNAKDTLA